MSIKYSTLISINIVALIFLGVILLTTNQVINHSFMNMEKNAILSKLGRLQETIDQTYLEMEKTTRDWAHWDDTWEYVSKPNQRFIETNFTSNTYFNYDMNISAIFNNDGKILYAGYCDLENQSVTAIPPMLEPFLRGFHPELKKLAEQDTYKGLLKTPGGSVMFVIIPVLKSDLSGPINGYLLMARFLKEDYITKLPGFRNIQVSAIDLSRMMIVNPKIKLLLLHIKSGDKIRFSGESMISAMDTIKDINGVDVFWVEVSSTMEATKIEKTTRNLILLIFILIFMIQSYILYRNINKKIIERVILAQEQIKEIALHPDQQGSVEYSGNDELTDLSKSINLMLVSLYKVKEELIIEKEKAEESDQLKSAFLASMNHELRTPLNHIMGFSQLITKAKSQNEILNYATLIYNSGDVLLTMIQDIFDLAIADQGILQPRVQTVNCAEHFKRNRDYLENLLALSGKQDVVELVFSPASISENLIITIDVGKVNQVLSNLFSNAIKFTHTGKIEFGFQLLSENLIQYYVKDTGIGIAAEKQEIIYDFFRQGDISNTRIYKGIGIGLAISKKATEIMNGKLILDSAEGKGSSFYLELPCESYDVQIDAEGQDQIKEEIPDFTKYSIMIVEDDKITMTIIRSMLEMTGARIIEGNIEQETVGNVNVNSQISAILIDLEMPACNGYQIAKLIRSTNPSMSMIGLSSYAIADESDLDISNIFNALIMKPIERDSLYQVLSKQLSKPL